MLITSSWGIIGLMERRTQLMMLANIGDINSMAFIETIIIPLWRNRKYS
jgi:hypothetical protein